MRSNLRSDSTPPLLSLCLVSAYLSAMLKRGTKGKALQGLGLRSCWLLVLVACLVLILTLVFMVQTNVKKSSSSFGFPHHKWNDFESVQFHPTVDFRNETELIWQIPESPRAVLFLAHGCNGRAANFWDKSSSCRNCVGLPEERLIVLQALSRKFAVLTVSSAGRCWTFGEEMFIVKNIISWWVQRNNLEKLPLVGLGASSGGYFVSALAKTVKFSSIALMIAEGIFDHMDITKNYPPTLFVHMPKDAHRQGKITEFLHDLKDKGIDTASVECMEFPLSSTFFADRIPGLDKTVSSELFSLFREKGFVDDDGYMKRDGRATRWREALYESKNLELDKNLFQHVQEELNLAFAYHEMTSLPSDQIFEWFEVHMKKPELGRKTF